MVKTVSSLLSSLFLELLQLKQAAKKLVEEPLTRGEPSPEFEDWIDRQW